MNQNNRYNGHLLSTNKGPAPGSILEGAEKPRFRLGRQINYASPLATFKYIRHIKPLNHVAEYVLNNSDNYITLHRSIYSNHNNKTRFYPMGDLLYVYLK